MEITELVTFDLDNLAHTLAEQLTNEEMADFIVSLDMAVADWDLTELAHKYFKAEHKFYKAEVKGYEYQ